MNPTISTNSPEYQAMSPDEKLYVWATGQAYDEEPGDEEVDLED